MSGAGHGWPRPAGDLRSAWDRRLQLGYSVSFDGVPQADRFWFEAAPTIAALRLRLKGYPMVAVCCGMAEREQDQRGASFA